MKRLLLSLIFALGITAPISAQLDAYRQYIEQYKKMAIEQMRRYRIPASIILAQGLIESNAGRSLLATTANNHFGIKVGGNWTGGFVLRDDDAPNEQFRKYRSVTESYEDHSLFLSTRGRYSSLFQLHPSDYVGWAHGLKSAGYATNPNYANMLIGIIERYNLSQYDITQKASYSQTTHAMESQRGLYLCNNLVYVIARTGDTYERIATDFNMKADRLRKYNEVDQQYALYPGDVVYLTKKARHAAKSIRGTHHVVKDGESLYTISQTYGVRLSRLYKWNSLPSDYATKVGDVLVIK